MALPTPSTQLSATGRTQLMDDTSSSFPREGVRCISLQAWGHDERLGLGPGGGGPGTCCLCVLPAGNAEAARVAPVPAEPRLESRQRVPDRTGTGADHSLAKPAPGPGATDHDVPLSLRLASAQDQVAALKRKLEIFETAQLKWLELAPPSVGTMIRLAAAQEREESEARSQAALNLLRAKARGLWGGGQWLEREELQGMRAPDRLGHGHSWCGS